MPRNGTTGVYTKPPGTTASTLTTISSSAYNTAIDDFVADANAPRPIVAGGTGASTAAAARTNLGGTTVGVGVFTAATAADAQAAMNAHLPTGFVGYYLGTSAPTGWVHLNGGSIGSVASGATTRASANCADLFALLWTNIPALVVQNSSGVVVTRGASGAADFAANRRLVLPDTRGEFIRGLDSSRGVDSGRVLASAQAAAMLNHTHSGTTENDGLHDHTLTVSSGAGVTATLQTTTGAPSQNNSFIADDGTHNHDFTTGNPSTGGGSETRPRNVAMLTCVKL